MKRVVYLVDWKRSEDGYAESKCGKYTIKPRFWGRVKPLWYEPFFEERSLGGTRNTMREAKQACDWHLRHEGGAK